MTVMVSRSVQYRQFGRVSFGFCQLPLLECTVFAELRLPEEADTVVEDPADVVAQAEDGSRERRLVRTVGRDRGAYGTAPCHDPPCTVECEKNPGKGGVQLVCEHDDAGGEKENAELQEDRDACDTSSYVPHP